jgi:ABC-type sugar transport system ATPase subunit
MSRIELSKVNKYYDKVHVLKDVDLTIEEGEFMTLLGPSGCGKTTTLRVISGLENPQYGTVVIDGKSVAEPESGLFVPPSKRNLNLVFQSYALWPHMTVFDNVAFGLTVKKTAKKEIQRLVTKALETMQIGEYAGRYPSELSGGQQQRVAIARAIVSQPKILLLDEPLSNLDAKLRVEMRTELKRLHKELKTTIVYVTHDQVEALTMSSKIAVYFEGVLSQCDPPDVVYSNPATLQVAEFIGNPKINFIETQISESGETSWSLNCDFGKVALNAVEGRVVKSGSDPVQDVTLAVRPEHVHILRKEEKDSFNCTISSILPAGSETLLEVELGKQTLMAKEIGQQKYEIGDSVWVRFEEDKMNLFNRESGELMILAV